MGLYLDTSCLLKLFFPEPESATVASQVAAEEHVVVSTLARLELRVQIQGRVAGGTLSAKSATALLSVVDYSGPKDDQIQLVDGAEVLGVRAHQGQGVLDRSGCDDGVARA
jgi:uncharacterized protein with PIN domain